MRAGGRIMSDHRAFCYDSASSASLGPDRNLKMGFKNLTLEDPFWVGYHFPAILVASAILLRRKS